MLQSNSIFHDPARMADFIYDWALKNLDAADWGQDVAVVIATIMDEWLDATGLDVSDTSVADYLFDHVDAGRD